MHLGVPDDHRQVGHPHQAHEPVVRFPGMGREHDQLLGRGQPEGRRAGAVERLAPGPQRLGVKCRHLLRAALQPEVDFEEVGRNLEVGQHGVVVVAIAGARDLPTGVSQGFEGPPVVGPRQQEIDVIHRT